MKIAVFFPYPPFPERSGAQRRCVDVLRAVAARGHQVALLSTDSVRTHPWTGAAEAAAAALCTGGVRIHRRGWMDRLEGFLAWRILPRVLGSTPRRWRVTASQRRWFLHSLEEWRPDAVLLNYLEWDALLPGGSTWRERVVLETHDLVSLNVAQRQRVEAGMPPPVRRVEAVDESILDLAMFDDPTLDADAEEYRSINGYRHVVAISAAERDRIQSRCPSPQVELIPAGLEARDLGNTHEGNALFPTGPNPFNSQGFAWFARRVLPSLRQDAAGFRLDVTGTVCAEFEPVEGVDHLGFVPDLDALWRRAAFAAIPVWGGTGQQIKVVEAMASGVAPVILAAAAKASPVRHGHDGLVAHSAEEFAAHCAALWRDRRECRRLGCNARESIRAGFGLDRLGTDWERVLAAAAGRPERERGDAAGRASG